MGQAVIAWLSAHGVQGLLLAFLVAFWIQIKPKVWAMLEAWTGLIKQQTLHDLLVSLVRAAEQACGEQPADPLEAKIIGEAKLQMVKTELADRKLMAPAAIIEAAVHEVKSGPAKVLKQALT